MGAADLDGSYRIRLEGRAEVLEAARERYRALLPRVTAFRWRHELSEAGPLVRAVRDAQGAVDEAIAVAQKRADAEGWDARSSVMACLQEVVTLRRALVVAAQERLKAHAGFSLGEALGRLERRLLTEPRLILPGRRWEVAEEVLPPAVPELAPAMALGHVAAEVFAKAPREAAALPTPAQLAALEAAWPPGTAALETLWRRLEALDVAGTLVRFLRTHARARPRRAPVTGPEQLLFAEHWRGVATARLDASLEALVGPVWPTGEERTAVLAWLAAHQAGDDERLKASARLSDGRAGLFELALVLGHGKARTRGDWQPMLNRALRADAAKGDEGWHALHARLSSLCQVMRAPSFDPAPPLERVRRRAVAPAPPPSKRPPSPPSGSLEGLVDTLQGLSGMR